MPPTDCSLCRAQIQDLRRAWLPVSILAVTLESPPDTDQHEHRNMIMAIVDMQ